MVTPVKTKQITTQADVDSQFARAERLRQFLNPQQRDLTTAPGGISFLIDSFRAADADNRAQRLADTRNQQIQSTLGSLAELPADERARRLIMSGDPTFAQFGLNALQQGEAARAKAEADRQQAIFNNQLDIDKFLTLAPHRERIARAGKTEITNNLGGGAGVEFAKQSGKDLAASFSKLGDLAQAASRRIPELDRFEKILDTGVTTGFGAQAKLQLGQLGRSLGIEVEGLPELEAINSIGNKLALEIRNPDSGFGLPGATSDRDVAFLRSMVPGLSNTPEGNRMMIDIARIGAQRNIEVANFAAGLQEQIESGQITVANARSQLAAFTSQDVFSDEQREQISVIAGSGGPELPSTAISAGRGCQFLAAECEQPRHCPSVRGKVRPR